jgi:predicted 3-demethylubiquinone-9 3-methyltransferase (glyoxalase superfamily)
VNPAIVPCLWFDSQAEEAARFYTRTFGDGRVLATSHYPESLDNPSGKPRGSVLTVDFEVLGRRFTALNGGPLFVINPSVSFFVHTDTAARTDELCAELAQGGRYLLAPGKFPWSERYAWVEDRFGVSWQVTTSERAPGGAAIVPCLMFADAQHGRAEEAMRAYAAVFPDSRIVHIERYGADRGPEGKVVHGRFVLAGQEFVAMDSHEPRGATFNEGLSFQVMCEDQAEVDRYWDLLSAGGHPGVCGWLEDAFGLSWQVVPKSISTWLTSRDARAKDRAFQAMLGMKKLDVAALEAAFASGARPAVERGATDAPRKPRITRA